MALDVAAYVETLREATRKAFAQVRAEEPDETWYAFALFTTPEYDFVTALCFGERGLAQAADHYARFDAERKAAKRKRKESTNAGASESTKKPRPKKRAPAKPTARALEKARKALRWSAGDSPYLDRGSAHFADAHAMILALPAYTTLNDQEYAERHQSLRAACFDVMRSLDEEGFFGRGAARETLVLNVVQGDQSNRSIIDNARLLNPLGPHQRMAAELDITSEVGTFVPLGSKRVYQISALAAAGPVVAACGSGGALFVFRERQELVAKVSDGSHWALALSRDGSQLLVSDDDEILQHALDGKSKKTLYKADGRLCALALSPDGSLLVWSDWKGGLAALRMGEAQPCWTLDGITKGIAFSPDGKQLVAGDDPGMRIVNAASGEVLHRFKHPIEYVDWAVDGQLAAGESSNAGTVYLWGPDRRLRHTLSIPKPLPSSAKTESYWGLSCEGVAFSPDGTRLASAHANGEAHVWRTSGGTRLTTVRGLHEALSAVCWVDDRTLAIAGRDVDDGPPVYLFDV